MDQRIDHSASSRVACPWVKMHGFVITFPQKEHNSRRRNQKKKQRKSKREKERKKERKKDR